LRAVSNDTLTARPLDPMDVGSRRGRGRRRRSGRSLATDPLFGFTVLVLVGLTIAGVLVMDRSREPSASTTTTRQAVVAELRPFVQSPDPGDTFTDPRGAFRLRINPSWERRPDDGDRHRWYVRSGSDRLRDSVAVAAEDVAPTMSVDAYLTVVQDRARDGMHNVTVVSERRFNLASGGPGGMVVYDGDVNGIRLRFLTIVTMSAGRAATATLVTQPDRFEEVRAAVAPFLETLQAL
jgi:hypothetical protein